MITAGCGSLLSLRYKASSTARLPPAESPTSMIFSGLIPFSSSALFEKQRDIVAKELQDLQEVYENLTFRCWFFAEAEKAGTVQIKHHLETLDIPKKMLPLVKKYGKSLLLEHTNETK